MDSRALAPRYHRRDSQKRCSYDLNEVILDKTLQRVQGERLYALEQPICM